MNTQPQDVLTLHLADEEATRHFAADLAAILGTGDIVALSGDLGAGKTTLARALVRQLAADDALEVPSPTYTLVQTYETRPKATHFDLYRLGDEAELDELGFEEAMETGIVLCEWPERSSFVMAEANLHLALAIAPDGGRTATLTPTPDITRRLGHSLAIRSFLDSAGFGNAERHPFPADASARRYERILHQGRSLILMDAPAMPAIPQAEERLSYARIAHIAQDVRPFIAMAEMLAEAGFRAPGIVAGDTEAGLLLLDDLGTEGVLDAQGNPIPERYEAVARLLARLHARQWPRNFVTSFGFTYEIPPFDRDAMMVEAGLLLDWYWPRMQHGRAAEAGERAAFHVIWNRLFDMLADAPASLVLRDVHSPNLLWQAQETGLRQIGLIDFQDAMIGPATYDLASLVQDARVDIDAALEKRLVDAYIDEAEKNGPPPDTAALRQSLAIMAAQRATKILGIFVRLHERDGKPQYLRHLPRLQTYLRRSLTHPALAELADFYEKSGLTGQAGNPHDSTGNLPA